jgi:hydroxymethylbilane synthase
LVAKNGLLRIATRSSRLALWQAEHVRARLQREHVGLNVELIPITTTGDRIIDRPLAKIGGKGLFIKELEGALFDQRADIAVHSMKDVPVDTPAGLHIPVILEREDPRDAVITNGGLRFDQLEVDATIGTSSLRRKSQLLARRDKLRIRDLRGNVTTRLEKLRQGEFDAIVLAAAGLKRLGFGAQISTVFETTDVIPAVGQGAIGIECRVDDTRTQALIAPLHDTITGLCVEAERAMSATLEGGCDVPLAAHATLVGGELHLAGLVASLDGRRIARDETAGPAADGVDIGRQLATALLAAGAGRILDELQRGQD